MDTIAKRIELERKHFPQGTTPEEIKLLDTVEQMLGQAYRAGIMTAERSAPQEWSNQSCFGYCIMAAERIGLSDQQLGQMTKVLHRIFDDRSLEEAARHYRQSPY